MRRAHFTYHAMPMQVRFGAGELASLGADLDAMGLSRALVISSPGHADLGARTAALLGPRAVGVAPIARMHVPLEVAADANARARELTAGACVAVGGGSAIGLAKAVALELAVLPIVAVPTTYAGSEMTPVWGLTSGPGKRTGRDARVLPRAVIYDVDLTMSLPVATSVVSAMNAMAHAVEALYAPDWSPIVSLMALEAVSSITGALPHVHRDPHDRDARTTLLYGAWLAGACLGATTMSLHHKLCHVIGGLLDLPHAATHSVVLPYVLAFNTPAAPDAVAALRGTLRDDDPARAIQELAKACDAPRCLRDLGMEASAIETVVKAVLATSYANPRPISKAAVRSVVTAAWEGRPLASLEAPDAEDQPPERTMR